MGVSRVQHERVLSDVAQILYERGVAPTTDMILKIVADFFAQYPVGVPLAIPYERIADGVKSNVDDLNTALAHFLFNIEVLYEACLDQVDDIMQLNQTLRNRLAHLQTRRKVLASRVEDYLLAQFNTDGYFLSLGDVFADTSKTDLNMTTAFIDTTAQQVSLPAISNEVTRIDGSLIGLQNMTVQVRDVKPIKPVSVKTVSPIQSAFDAIDGTAWYIDVTTETADPVTAILNFGTSLPGNGSQPPTVTRIEFTPYCVTPMQVFFAVAQPGGAPTTTSYTNFGGKITQTKGEQIVFVDNPQNISQFQMVLRKDQHDYVDASTGRTFYHYIFGAKDIAMYRYVYDDAAIFVTAPLAIPADLKQDHVIDAVSVVVEDHTPADTTIAYYVANDPNPSGTESIGDLNWRPISPLSETPQQDNIVHFDGAEAFSVFIRSTPQSSADLQLIPLGENADPTQSNPTPAIIPGTDIYRLASFGEDVLPNSWLLEEGINSTRIYYTDYHTAAVASLDYWQPVIANGTAQVVYGHIDTGNEFFFGGDVGSAGKSVYVETYLDAASDLDTILGDFRKSDPNSQTWDVRVLQNGRELAYLPAGTNSAQIPWKFQQGLNHIGLLINIPTASQAYPNAQVGTINLLGTRNLYDYGTVKLDTWSYVSFFDLQYNQTGQPDTFTIHEGEIISRRKPTTNFRLSYNKSTKVGPQAIRFRADLGRTFDNPNVSPTVKSYRLRFAYGS